MKLLAFKRNLILDELWIAGLWSIRRIHGWPPHFQLLNWKYR